MSDRVLEEALFGKRALSRKCKIQDFKYIHQANSMEVDWAGDADSFADNVNGEPIPVFVFAAILLEIVESCHGCCSTVFSSQFDPTGWQTKIGEGPLGKTVLDRIFHDSYTIFIDGEESSGSIFPNRWLSFRRVDLFSEPLDHILEIVAQFSRTAGFHSGDADQFLRTAGSH